MQISEYKWKGIVTVSKGRGVHCISQFLMVSDNGLISVHVLQDRSAAFDSVHRNILLERLANPEVIKGSVLQ